MDTKRRSKDVSTGRSTVSIGHGAACAAATTDTGRGARILVCDGDPSVAEAARTLLEATGYTVRTASSSDAVDRWIEREPPDFALVDVSPGSAAMGAVASRLARAMIPFVITSTPNDDTLIQHAVHAGAVGCFFKPLDVSALVPSIAVWMVRAAELRRLMARESSLREALQSSRGVGTAVGILMERGGIDAEHAFDSLRRRARDERLSVSRLASRIIDERSTGARDLPRAAGRDELTGG